MRNKVRGARRRLSRVHDPRRRRLRESGTLATSPAPHAPRTDIVVPDHDGAAKFELLSATIRRVAADSTLRVTELSGMPSDVRLSNRGARSSLRRNSRAAARLPVIS
jgi:hypothetical protein